MKMDCIHHHVILIKLLLFMFTLINILNHMFYHTNDNYMIFNKFNIILMSLHIFVNL